MSDTANNAPQLTPPGKKPPTPFDFVLVTLVLVFTPAITIKILINWGLPYLFEHPATRQYRERIQNLPPLHKAVRVGDVAQVRRILDSGANPMHPCPEAPLFYLLEGEKYSKDAAIEIVGLFLSRRVDVNSRFDPRGKTLMDCAILGGAPALVKFLLDGGALVNASSSAYSGGTALHNAESASTVVFLADRGAELNSRDSSGRTPCIWP